MGKAWAWLGTDTVTANKTYARFLPKNSYAISKRVDDLVSIATTEDIGKTTEAAIREERGAVMTIRSSETLLAGSTAEILPGEEHFTNRYDVKKTGICTRAAFQLALPR